MKILDFSKGLDSLPITFDRETVMVMAFVPKVIVFENRSELHTFKDVFEELEDVLN